MVAQPLDSILTGAFLNLVAEELAARGFVSDEHDFAPYRETISTHFDAIESALRERGVEVSLLPGFINHDQAGYAYFIYDADRFCDAFSAGRAVSAWLNEQLKPATRR